MTDEIRAEGPRGALPWIALAVALSAPIAMLLRSLDEVPYPASLLLAPMLAARLRWVRPDCFDARAPQRGPGLALVGAGLAMALLGLLGDAWSVAWLGMPIALVGMAMLTGAVSPAPVALAFWCVPIPTSLFYLTTPWAETFHARVAHWPIALLTSRLAVGGPHVRFGVDDLDLTVLDGGLHALWVLGLVVFYAALFRREGVAWLLRAGALLPFLAVATQLALVAIAIGLLATGAPLSGENWLAWGGWMAIFAIGVVWAERVPDDPGRRSRPEG